MVPRETKRRSFSIFKTGPGELAITGIAFLIAIGMIFGALGHLSLMEPDEGRNAEIAREMNQAHAWLIPTLNGVVYLDKPAFFFKLVGISYALFGTSEMSARLPSALSALALLALIFAFCRREYNGRCAGLAVIVIATSLLFIAFSRLVIFEMVLSFFVSGAILAGYIAEEHSGRVRLGWLCLSAAGAGLATLVKGPIGFILPLLVLGIFHWIDGRPGALKRFFHPLPVIVFIGIVLPWFLSVLLAYPDFFHYGIVEESIHRFATPEFRRIRPFYYYVVLLAAGLFPWSILAPESIVAAWRSRSQWLRADRLLVVWGIAVFLFFTISQSKRPNYVLTAGIALGILNARLFDLAFSCNRGRAWRILMRGAIILTLLCAGAAGFLVFLASQPAVRQWLFGFRRTAEACWEGAPVPIAGILFLVALLAAFAAWRRKIAIAFCSFALLPGLLLIGGFGALKCYSNTRSSKGLAEHLQDVSPDAEIVCLASFSPGLPFYLRRNLILISKDGSELTSNYILFRLKKKDAWPDTIVPMEKRDSWLAARNHPVCLIGKDDLLNELESIARTRGGVVNDLGNGWWGAMLPAPEGNVPEDR